MSAGPAHFAVLSAVVFAIGLTGVLSRTTVAARLVALTALFLAPVIALVGFAHTGQRPGTPATGDAMGALAAVAAGVEVLVGATMGLLVWRRTGDARADGDQAVV